MPIAIGIGIKIVLLYLIVQLLLVAKRKFNIKVSVTCFLLILSFLGISGLFSPFYHYLTFLVYLILLLHACIIFIPEDKKELLIKFSYSLIFNILIIFSLSFVIPFGISEIVISKLAKAGLVKTYKPLHTVPPPGTEDWRMVHITSDKFREPDPILLWKPIAVGGPYNSQRFKGPLADIPKPKNVFRIMTYGDSNTDGPPKGGWPEQIQNILSNKKGEIRFEVLNAGVAGYSSFQGLKRFNQEITKYQPNLVFVSFGWNDIATAMDIPDKDFKPPASTIYFDLLNKYTFYLMVKHYVTKYKHTNNINKKITISRVSLLDYIENMKSFKALAQKHNTKIIFLTRPHRPSEIEIKKNPGWRSKVPTYNNHLRLFSKNNSAFLIDIQNYFETLPISYFADYSHLTLDGHKKMAQYILKRSSGFIKEFDFLK